MAGPNLDPDELKHVLKAALAEAMLEQREILHEIFAEVLEDFALAEAIREGQQGKSVSRHAIRRILRRKP